MLKICSLRIKL